MLNTLFSLSKACSEFTRRGGREVSMRDETVFLRPNSRYHANPSSDRVFFRRRCNDLTFPWRAVAYYWGEGGNESRQQGRVSKVRTDPFFCSQLHFGPPTINAMATRLVFPVAVLPWLAVSATARARSRDS